MTEAAPDPRRLSLILNEGRPLVPCQDQLLTEKPSAWIRCLVGGLGSAKTSGAALAMLAHAARNPWTPKYRGTKPFSIIFGITWSVLKDSAFAAFFNIVPEGVIRRHRKADRVTELVNGHEFYWRTAKGKNTGASATGLWLDEAHLISGGADQWLDYQARVRDMKGATADFPEPRIIIVTGVPINGWLAEVFADDKSASDPERLTLHARTGDNKYLPANYLTQLAKSVSKKEARAYFEGEWISPQGATFYEWDPSKHLVRDNGNVGQPCHLSIDVGTRGAILWAQERERMCRDEHGKTYRDRGLHIVDEFLPEGGGVRKALLVVKQRQWQILRGRSRIYVDPNADTDELEAIENAFPGIDIVRKTRGDAAYFIVNGCRAVNSALCDAYDNVRLTVNAEMPREPRSLIRMMTGYRMDEQRRSAIKDNRTDHVADCLRYLVADLIPLSDAPALRVFPGR